jgi:hypothetical protein
MATEGRLSWIQTGVTILMTIFTMCGGGIYFRGYIDNIDRTHALDVARLQGRMDAFDKYGSGVAVEAKVAAEKVATKQQGDIALITEKLVSISDSQKNNCTMLLAAIGAVEHKINIHIEASKQERN